MGKIENAGDKSDLLTRVSEGMHAAEKQIDAVKKKPARPTEEKHCGAKSLSDIASKVKTFAERTHNVVTLDGKTYIRVGAYQYLAHLMNIVPDFDFDPESTSTEVFCVCKLFKDGDYLSSATMYADKTEEFLRDKPDFAVLGMAQTRAFARAMKNIYGFIMESAGYQSVSVEEVEK